MPIQNPLYIQISNQINDMISSGELKYGQSIPSERELSELFNVNRKTLRKATSLLVEEGVLVRIRGKGTYIEKASASYMVDKVYGFNEMLRNNGMEPSSRLLYTEKRKARRKFAKILNVDENDDIYRLVRLRLGNNQPMALQNTYISYNIFPHIEKIDFTMFSLYDVLNQYKITIKRTLEKITPIIINNPEAKILKRAPGAPGFMTEETSYDVNGLIIDYTKTYTNNLKITADAFSQKANVSEYLVNDDDTIL
ncbi:GntR family transcriptional regulator [Youxingia wuxianensis]|uniref:GntR family transcriptional regulator n=1 Tax=Youxingia wuxianensis TaxID=2763678 RepID=A0A926EU81_9FIRM|nr:GntR family transcriptional regulator [Youxingia wuxianensis]MBC8586564.1 GntR family transcriptional regulator [Youxingia wuxianensis]